MQVKYSVNFGSSWETLPPEGGFFGGNPFICGLVITNNKLCRNEF